MVRVALTALLFAVTFGALTAGESPEVAAGVVAFSLISSIVVSHGFSKSERRAMSFMACGLIDADITVDCEKLVGGVNSTFYIANFDDVASITPDGSNSQLATAITMVATKTFFTISGQLQSLEPKITAVKGKYVNQYEHEITFLVFDITAAAKKQLLAMKDGNFMAIIRNNNTGTDGDTKHEIYGAEAGMKMEITERLPQDAETLGAFKITLKTQEYAREGKLPLTFYITDSATTEAAVAALL